MPVILNLPTSQSKCVRIKNRRPREGGSAACVERGLEAERAEVELVPLAVGKLELDLLE